MYSSILVVGGGLKFEGASAWLKSKISLNAQQVYYGGLYCRFVNVELVNYCILL